MRQGDWYHRDIPRWGDTDRDLLTHLSEIHSDMLSKIGVLLPEQDDALVNLWSVYCEAVAWKVRQGAPLASYSIDRRAIANYTTAFERGGIEELICFSCARRFPHIATASSHDIQWHKALSASGVLGSALSDMQFCGLPLERAEKIFGIEASYRKYIVIQNYFIPTCCLSLRCFFRDFGANFSFQLTMYTVRLFCKAYLQKYGEPGAGQPNLNLVTDDFEDFVLQVPFKNKVVVMLCCPEDRRCSRPGCTERDACCDQCELPCCRECKAT